MKVSLFEGPETFVLVSARVSWPLLGPLRFPSVLALSWALLRSCALLRSPGLSPALSCALLRSPVISCALLRCPAPSPPNACCFFSTKVLDMVYRKLAITSKCLPISVCTPPSCFPATMLETVPYEQPEITVPARRHIYI